ncbi:MAG: hypothetical protein K6E51_12830 [Treponema sp.]|nr:hypothetical protein [Treponema sp.]
MIKRRTFISFDYDNDSDLKNLLVGQSKNPDSPFEIVDMSIKEAIATNWRENARRRIKSCDVVIIICGTQTHRATGVAAELKIAQEEGIPYFCLNGRPDKSCFKPLGARTSDIIYRWSWDNLKSLINGAR